MLLCRSHSNMCVSLLVFIFSYVVYCLFALFFFFFKQKTAYEMRISDWSSDVCSSDLAKPSPTSPAATRSSGLGPFGSSGMPMSSLALPVETRGQIGRASCRERVCPYV